MMPTVSEALAEAAQRDPPLASYYELHRKLLELQEKARNEIAATLELSDQEALQARLLQGLPLAAFDQLPIQAERFSEQAAVIVQALTAYYTPHGDLPSITPVLSHSPATEGEAEGTGGIEGGLPADAAEWVALAQRRFEENQIRPETAFPSLGHPFGFASPSLRSGTLQGRLVTLSPHPTLAEIAADVALEPYLAWAAEQVLPHVNQERWMRGHCPVCGGSPDLAFLDEEAGARRLACSRCNSQWRYARIGCPFCGADDPTQIVYYPSDDEVYRLYVCQACRRYLKTKDLRKAGGQVWVEVERITTVAMDAAARQEGYG